MQTSNLVNARSLGLAFFAGLALSGLAVAQAPTSFRACYVPSIGALYLVGLSGLPSTCLSAAHVSMGWTDGIGALRSGSNAGGDLSGTYPNPTVARLQGTAVASTPPTGGQMLTYNAATSSWGPGAAGGGATGPAGGDLSGSYPNPAVAQLRGTAVASTAPTSGQVLMYDGATWSPGLPSLATGSVSTTALADGAVTGAKVADDAITGNKIANGSITMSDLGPHSVGAVQLESGAVSINFENVFGASPASVPSGGVGLTATVLCSSGFYATGGMWFAGASASSDIHVLQQQRTSNGRGWQFWFWNTGASARSIEYGVACMQLTP